MGCDQKGPSILLKFKYSNKHDALIPNLASNIVYGYQIKSYEHFNFENLEFEGPIPGRKSAKNNNGHKRPLLVAKIEESFQLFFYYMRF